MPNLIKAKVTFFQIHAKEGMQSKENWQIFFYVGTPAGGPNDLNMYRVDGIQLSLRGSSEVRSNSENHSETITIMAPSSSLSSTRQNL